MTKNLEALCKLLDKTDIDYEIITDNEISIEMISLTVKENDNPQFITTNEDISNARFNGMTFLHIYEDKHGFFSIADVNGG